MMIRRVLLVPAAILVMILMASSAWAISGVEALKYFNRDSDQTLEIAEVIAAATKLFHQLDTNNDMTLSSKETAGRLTEDEWKIVNKDEDQSLELDEWLTIVRQRFNAADTNKNGKLTAQELDSPADQSLIKLIIK
jgi:EF hand